MINVVFHAIIGIETKSHLEQSKSGDQIKSIHRDAQKTKCQFQYVLCVGADVAHYFAWPFRIIPLLDYFFWKPYQPEFAEGIHRRMNGGVCGGCSSDLRSVVHMNGVVFGTVTFRKSGII